MTRKCGLKCAAKRHRAPKLKIPKSTCDKQLSVRNSAFPAVDQLFNHSFACHILGAPGSGKTTLLCSLMSGPLRKVFHKIYLVGPVSSMKDTKNPFDDIPAGQKYEEPSRETIMKIMKEVNENKNEKKFSLLILDDCAAFLKDPETAKLLTSLYQNRRHQYLSIFNLSQNNMCFPARLRELVTSVILLRSIPKVRRHVLEETAQMSPRTIRAVTEIVFENEDAKETHPYLAYCSSSGRIFKGLDTELMFSEDNA